MFVRCWPHAMVCASAGETGGSYVRPQHSRAANLLMAPHFTRSQGPRGAPDLM